MRHVFTYHIATRFLFLLLAVALFAAQPVLAQYLTEDFESAFAGDPGAPPGWVQNRVVLIGDGVPEAISTAGEKDWEQNVWTGAAWSKVPSSAGTQPSGAQSGTGVLWMNDWYFGSTTSAYGTRRMESPTMNLAASTSPYVRFYYFCAYSADRLLLRVDASSNGGATWNTIMFIPPNATITGTMAAATPWQRVNVLIPAAYRTASAKIGIAMSNTYGTQNLWIDNLTVAEFTPTTITSDATGNWESTTTWVGGVVPSADNHVVIAAGHTVTCNVNMARVQNLTIDGTLNYGTSTTQLVHIAGNLVVNATGILDAFNGTTGRKVFIGGSFTNNGTCDFSKASSVLAWVGGAAASYSGGGVLATGYVRELWHANNAGVTYSAPMTAVGSVVLQLGPVNPNGNLTLGDATVAATQIVERGMGNFSATPVFASGMTSRSVTYSVPLNTAGVVLGLPPQTLSTGFEIEDISGTRTVSGTLLMNTYNNVALSTPVTVGTSTTGVLTLTRGIIVTTPTNLLTLTPFVAGVAGTAPSTATPPTTHGSYISGPMRIDFPASGLVSRNFALGVGTAFNGATPSSNVLKTLTLALASGSWASQTITASIGGAPTGTVNPPLTNTFGVRSYRLDLNGGPDLPAAAFLTVPGNNYTFGNSDNMLGLQQDLRVAQAPATAGPWSERSAATGSGAFVNNTNYTRSTSTGAPGPIGPLGTNGEYFTLATVAGPLTHDSTTTLQASTANLSPGATNAEIIAVRVNVSGGTGSLNLTQLNLNTNGTTNPAHITNARVYYTGTSSTFATTTPFGSPVPSPGASFNVTGTQALVTGSNYFWLAYDIAAVGPVNGNLVDGECTSVTVGGTPYTPTVTAPAGSRTIVVPISSFPYFQDFEGATDEGWSTAILSGSVNDWVRGTPAKVQITSAYSGVKAWVTKLTGTYSNSHNAYVQSPPFNFASLVNDPLLSFWHNFQGESLAGYDAGAIEYTTNGGATWRRVDSTLGTGPNYNTAVSTNWHNYGGSTGSSVTAPKFSSLGSGVTGSTGYAGHVNGWIQSTTILTGLAGKSSVSFRWRWGTDGSGVNDGWAFDDVSIQPQTPMTYVSSTATQGITTSVPVGAANQQIIRIAVVTTGTTTPISATSFTLNTSGSTNAAADITSAKLYYTGTSGAFSTATPFGSPFASPNGSFIITGSQVLATGTNYFWLAYDIAGGATVGNFVDAQANSVTVGGTPYTPTDQNPAGNREIKAPLAGTKTVGSGGNYPNLTDAIAEIATLGLSGNINLDIISDLSLDLTPDTAIVINPWLEVGGGGYTLTLRPSGAPRTIAGNAAGAVININGADRVVIDGRIGGVGRNLTISNANTSGGNVVVRVTSPSAADSANDITIRNCNILGSGRSSTLVGVTVDNGAGSNPLSSSTNVIIRDNYIDGAVYALYMTGAAQTRMGTGNQVLNNEFGAVMGHLNWGILVQYQNGVIVNNNDVKNLVGASFADMRGIQVGICKNSTVSNNRVHNMSYTGTTTYKVYGINQTGTFSVGDPSINTYFNNAVYDIASTATSASWNTSGINNNGGYGDKYYHNSVYLTGQMSGSTGSAGSAAFSNGNGISATNSDAIEVRNNAFFMNGFSASASAPLYAHYTTRTSYTGSILNYNSLRSVLSGGGVAYLGRFNALNQADLTAWQTATGQEANSIGTDPTFNSPTNLAPLVGSPLLAAGDATVPVGFDILGVPRANPPTIGAYETAGDYAGPAIAYTALGNTASTANRTVTANITDISGVGGGGNAPRIYFRKGTTGAYTFANATGIAGNDYTFTINNSAIGGVTGGDVIQYYIAAQDAAGTPNGTTNPAGGSGTNPPGTTAPASPNSYFILLEVSSFPYSEDFEDPSPDVVVTRMPDPFPIVQATDMKFEGEGAASSSYETEQLQEASLVMGVAGEAALVSGLSARTASGGLGWTTSSIGGGINEWVRATPAKTYLNGAYSGTKAYVTAATLPYSSNHNGALESPVFNFTSLGSDPVLAFWQKGQSEVGYDGMVVEMSTNGGVGWVRVDSTLGTGGTFNTTLSTYWYNSSSTSGPLAPPKFTDTTATKYVGHTNGWIHSTTRLAGTAGLSDVRIRFRFQTDASVVREGIAVDDVSIYVQSVTTAPIAGWNIISNPVTSPVPGDSVKQLFPQALFSYGFKFVPGSGYQQEYRMFNGVGYWEKFPASPSVVTFSGTQMSSYGVSVVAGWNLIGSISVPVDTAYVNANSVPSNIVTTSYYGFGTGGYGSGDAQLLPGKGYWVKTNAPGTLNLGTAGPAKKSEEPRPSLEGLNEITIRDASGHAQTLRFGVNADVSVEAYELPPLPPAEAFDARFVAENGGYGVMVHDAENATLPVSVQSVAYPLTVEWNITSGSYELVDAAGNRTITGAGSMQITNPSVNQFTLRLGGSELPKEFALDQNYPNPFNPTTSIKFALPVESRVTVEVYNALGQRVRTLVNENRAAGYHVAEWNGTGNANQLLGSGVYFVRLDAQGVDGRSFTNLRKMVLMK